MTAAKKSIVTAAAGVFAAGLAIISCPASAEDMALRIDEARPVHLSSPITGVVVGNAGIADVIVHDANMLFVLGKSVGVTSVVAVDARGRTVYSGQINVTAVPTEGLVVVQRGLEATALDCRDRCVSVPSPYATGAALNTASAAASARSAFARGGAGGGN